MFVIPLQSSRNFVYALILPVGYIWTAHFLRLSFAFLREKNYAAVFALSLRPPRAPLPNLRHNFLFTVFGRLRSPRVPVLVTHPRVQVKSTVLRDCRVWVTKTVARVRENQLSQSAFSFAAGVSQLSQSKLRYSTGVDRTAACVFAHCV